MPIPTLSTTPAELHTELYWAVNIQPVAEQHGFDATQLEMDPGDRHQHLLKSPVLGEVVLVVRTDRPPICCRVHDAEPTLMASCEEAARLRRLR